MKERRLPKSHKKLILDEKVLMIMDTVRFEFLGIHKDEWLDLITFLCEELEINLRGTK